MTENDLDETVPMDWKQKQQALNKVRYNENMILYEYNYELRGRLLVQVIDNGIGIKEEA